MRVSDAFVAAGGRAAVMSVWDYLWGAQFDGPLGKAVQVLIVVLIAVIVRLVAHRVIDMVVNRIVNGAKRRRGAQDTQALLNSPVSAARIVQRTRTLGSVLNNVLAVVIIIVALVFTCLTSTPRSMVRHVFYDDTVNIYL